jgi:hypothetical protein
MSLTLIGEGMNCPFCQRGDYCPHGPKRTPSTPTTAQRESGWTTKTPAEWVEWLRLFNPKHLTPARCEDLQRHLRSISELTEQRDRARGGLHEIKEYAAQRLYPEVSLDYIAAIAAREENTNRQTASELSRLRAENEMLWRSLKGQHRIVKMFREAAALLGIKRHATANVQARKLIRKALALTCTECRVSEARPRMCATHAARLASVISREEA